MGFTFLITCIAVEFYLLFSGLWKIVFHPDKHGNMITLDITTMILALYGAAAALISYSCLLGKITPFQCVIMTIFEMFLYSLNEEIGITVLYIVGKKYH